MGEVQEERRRLVLRLGVIFDDLHRLVGELGSQLPNKLDRMSRKKLLSVHNLEAQPTMIKSGEVQI